MTKKHYEAIAAMIQTAHSIIAESAHAKTVIRLHAYNLADYFAQDNPKFNRTRFLQACGVESCKHNAGGYKSNKDGLKHCIQCDQIY